MDMWQWLFSCKIYYSFFAAIPLSIDHKPDRSDERQRIEQAGGFILWAGKIHLLFNCHPVHLTQLFNSV